MANIKQNSTTQRVVEAATAEYLNRLQSIFSSQDIKLDITVKGVPLTNLATIVEQNVTDPDIEIHKMHSQFSSKYSYVNISDNDDFELSLETKRHE